MTYCKVNWIIAALFFSSSHVAANQGGSSNTTESMSTESAISTVMTGNATVDLASTASTTTTTESESNITSYVSTAPDNSTTGSPDESNSTVLLSITASTSASGSTNSTLNDTGAAITSQYVTTDLPTTTTPETVKNTTSTVRLSIVEQAKNNWKTAVAETNFSNTVINGSLIKQVAPSDFIDLVVEFYKQANETELQSFLESEGVDELASLLLNTTILETSILEEFNSSQNASVYGFLASLTWLNDEILGQERFLQLAVQYGQELEPSTENVTNNSTASELATVDDFVHYILSNATAEVLFDALCRAIQNENLESVLCTPTTMVTTTVRPLPGPEIFQSTWNSLMSSSSYGFLSPSQDEELQNLTPENMTTGIVDYVNGLSNSEIQDFVDANVTKYVSSVLREHGSAAGILGKEVVDAFAGSENKEDLFYLYLSFLNNLYSREGKFEEILRGFVNATSSSTARVASACDTSSITARGLCCYTITTEAQNQTTLRDSVCDELNGGEECIASFNVNEDDEEEEPTSSPVPNELTTGAIIGIVIGGLALIIIIIIIIFFLWKRSNKKKSKVNPQEEEPDSDNMEMDGRTSTDNHPRARSRTNGHAPSRNTSLSG